jgi:imidazolonepropionase-like amidohydrolase
MARQAEAGDGALVLVGGTVFVSPTQEPIRDAVVRIEQRTIAEVGTRRAVRVPQAGSGVDCSGLTITAGFWNSHVHFFERKWADAAATPGPELERQLEQTFTRYGFTSVFDLSSTWENTRRIRDRIESGEVAGPRIRSTGQGLVPPGILPPDAVLSLMGVTKDPMPEIADPSRATAVATRLLSEGVDGIKVFLRTVAPATRSFPEGGIEAAVEAAHGAGKPAFAHPTTGADVLLAIRAGVDVVAHTTPHSGPWEETLLAAMRERRPALTPTLMLWKSFLRHDRVSVQERVVKTAVDQLRAWRAAGGEILFGTDLGAVDPAPGEEYELMAQAGMSFREILASLTTAPAARFAGPSKAGRVAPGVDADLVVLKGDPAQDIRALADVQYTLRAGRMVYRAAA